MNNLARLDPEERMKVGMGVLVSHVALLASFVEAAVAIIHGGLCAFCGFLGHRSGSAGHGEGNGTKRGDMDFV